MAATDMYPVKPFPFEADDTYATSGRNCLAEEKPLTVVGVLNLPRLAKASRR